MVSNADSDTVVVRALRRGPGAVSSPQAAAPPDASRTVTLRLRAGAEAPLAKSPGRSTAWAPWALLVWALGAALCIARLVIGSLRVRAIARRAEPLDDAGWTAAAAELGTQLGLKRPVRLLASFEVPVAMTAGVRRPVLLLHPSARKWPADRRRVVLLHELAHVRRGDWITLLAAEIAGAIYWFHPLAWVSRRQARAAGERACDDLVLDSGTKPSVYAAHLLGIVRSMTPGMRGGLPVMAMARPSQFEGRMRAILNPGLHRRGPSRAEVRASALGLFSCVLVLAAFEPWAPREAEGAAFPTDASVASSVLAGRGAAKPDCPSKEKQKDGWETDAFVPATAKVSAPGEPAEAPEAADAPDVSDAPSGILDAIFDMSPGKGNGNGKSSAPAPGLVLAGKGGRSGSDWYSRAMDLHHDEQWDAAIAGFAKAIELGYREGASSYNIACGYSQKGDRDKAFEWLRKADDAGFSVSGYLESDDDLDNLRSDPRWSAFKREARARKNEENRNEGRAAARRFEKLDARAPKEGEPYFQIAHDLLKTGEYALAAKAYGKSAELGHRPGTSFYNQACALSLGGQKAAALDSLQKSLENGFDDPSLFRRDDDLDELRKEPRFRELQSLADDLEMPTVNWGARFLRSTERSEWRKAVRKAQEAADRHPGMGRVWFTLGFTQIRADRADAAAESFQKALQMGYRKPTTLYNLACAHARLNQKDRAFDYLFQALDAGFDGNGTLRHDVDLDNLRGDPRLRKAQKMADERSNDGD